MPTSRRLLAVMFTDIVGYSAMVNSDERRARELLGLQRAKVRDEVFRHEGRVVDTIGDGHLVTFDNARAAIECAAALQLAFLRRNAGVPEPGQLRLRIGIHVGDIERSGGRVFGDGVNVAARLEPLSPRGGICASAQAIAQLHGPLRALFASQGVRELKNIAEKHEVFALEEDALEAAAPHLPAANRAKVALRRFGPALAAGLAVLAIGAASALAWRSGAFVPADDASIAVLPLENLSHDDASADFVAGLHDSLLTEVSTMPQLKVISRTSVMRYAHDAPPVPVIARALNVSYILEGSVQRSARRVRINVQLIRARSDQHIWAKTYDRDADDLFDVQSQIAREIARSTQGRVAIDAMPVSRRPTQSVDAYDLYLRAIALEDNDPKLGREPATAQIALLEQAVALDPDFALAWAALARYNIWSANWAGYEKPDAGPGYLKAAADAAHRARQLAPSQPETLVASALVTYWQRGDKREVARQLEQALAQRPGYSLALLWLASVYDRLGDAARSSAALATLNALDPYNERVYTLIAQSLLNQRKYAELEDTYARWRVISESPAFVDFWATEAHFFHTGSFDARREYLARPAGKGVTEDDLEIARWELAIYEHRFDDAAAIAKEHADQYLRRPGGDYTPLVREGLALTFLGKPAAARPYLEAAAAYLRRAVGQDAKDSYSLGQLSLVEAMLGELTDAIAHGKRAYEQSAPASGQPPSLQHSYAGEAYAQTLAWSGRLDDSLQLLETLMQPPSILHMHQVRLDPAWGPLAQDPRFALLLERYRPR